MWLPLAASWLLMSSEGPIMNAVVARLANPEINLAALGGIVHPVSLLIEAPIIMLLSASTALGKDWASYLKIRNYMLGIGGSLTLLHILVSYTPLYDMVVVRVMGVPEQLIEPGRIGMMIMVPWTFFIGLRRFNQGLMIRNGRSDAVAKCTVVRLVTIVTVLAAGYYIGTIPGVIVGATAMALGVTLEGAYAAYLTRSILKIIRNAPPVEPLTNKAFLAFYVPLVMTSLLNFLGSPIGSAMISRMPNPVESLAVWAVLGNLVFILRSTGVSYNEVVVALLDERGSYPHLKAFSRKLMTGIFIVSLVFTATPISRFWFNNVAALKSELAQMAVVGMWILMIVPMISVLQSLYQGTLVFSRRTTGVSQAVAAYLLSMFAVLALGVVIQKFPGVYVAGAAFAAANIAQAGWLWFRSRKILDSIRKRDLELTQLEHQTS